MNKMNWAPPESQGPSDYSPEWEEKSSSTVTGEAMMATSDSQECTSATRQEVSAGWA